MRPEISKQNFNRAIIIGKKMKFLEPNDVAQMKEDYDGTLNKKFLDWINDASKSFIIDFILDYDNKNTQKSYLSAFASIARALNLRKIQRDFSDLASGLNQEVVDEEKKNSLSDKEKERYLPYSEILKIRQDLDKRFEEIEDPKGIYAKQINYTRLLFHLYTQIPPVRLDYSQMPFNEFKTDDPNQIYREGKDMYLYISDDKVSKSHPPLLEKLPIPLVKVINESMDHIPRDTVIPKSKQTVADYLNFYNLNIDAIRSAYISNEYEKGLTLRQKEEIARKMRHSRGIAELNYKKIVKDPALLERKAPEIRIRSKEPFDRKAHARRYYQLNKEKFKGYREKYYNKHKDEFLARKHLSMLNRGEISESKPETLEKYNIVKKNDVYVFAD